MAAKILFTNTSAEIVEDARERSPSGFELIVAAPGSAEYVAALPDAEYLLGNVQGMDDAFYRTAQKLRLVQLFSAGYDHVNLDAARRAGVPVANNGGANSRAVAEHTPHLAGFSRETRLKQTRNAFDNVLRVVKCTNSQRDFLAALAMTGDRNEPLSK